MDSPRVSVHPRGVPNHHFHYALEFQRSNTRKHVRLLGPCFKTGRLKTLRQLAGEPADPRSQPTPILKGYNTPRRCHLPSRLIRPVKMSADPFRANMPTDKDFGRRITGTKLTSSVSLSTISRTVSLSFQSAFHLSLTVLVRYRSLACI